MLSTRVLFPANPAAPDDRFARSLDGGRRWPWRWLDGRRHGAGAPPSGSIRAATLLGGIGALLVAICLAAPVRAAQGDLHPLEPPDTSSPRATLRSFVESMDEVYREYVTGRSGEAIGRHFKRAVDCLDLSEVPPSLHDDVGGYSALLLMEIFDRIELPDPEQVPALQDAGSDPLEVWTIPKTEISIRRVEQGESRGKFLFSPGTVEHLVDFYERTRQLPRKSGTTKGLLALYYDNPGGMVPLHWAEWLPHWSMTRLFDRPIWKWLSVLAFVAVAVAVTFYAHRLVHRFDRQLAKRSIRLGSLVLAVSIGLWAWALEAFVDDAIGLRGPAEAAIKRGALLIAFSTAIVALFALFEVVANTIVVSNRIRTTSAQAHFIRIIVRIIGIGISVYLVVVASEYIGWAVAPVVAGLSIGGLAVALAARPTIENVIGGLTLFMDAPARVGDFCRYGDRVGTIEEVGLRSTRIRSLDRTVVTVPNSEFSQMPIENFNRRDMMLFRTNIGLRYETTPDQLRFVIAEIRQMLLGHPRVSPDPARARFAEFGQSSLDIEIFAYVRTRDWNEYLAIREDLNLRIMDIVRRSGTAIAFPSRTLYWRRDAGLDEQLGREAEHRVAQMRDEGQLPFPEFAPEQRAQFENSLDYPPPGSPDCSPRPEGEQPAAGRGTEKQTGSGRQR